jgi:hypothetical protein
VFAAPMKAPKHVDSFGRMRPTLHQEGKRDTFTARVPGKSVTARRRMSSRSAKKSLRRPDRDRLQLAFRL